MQSNINIFIFIIRVKFIFRFGYYKITVAKKISIVKKQFVY